MKLNLKKRRTWIVAGALVLMTATPGFALFGIGDIVFDPTSYASLLSQATTALNQLRTVRTTSSTFHSSSNGRRRSTSSKMQT